MIGSNVRKVLLFGVLGAMGCLGGWFVGELFLWVCLPTNKETGGSLASKPVMPPPTTRVEPAVLPPPALAADFGARRSRPAEAPPELRAAPMAASKPAPPAEFAERLEKAKAKTGDVQITLIWSNVNDLDLHCIEPSREEIFYAHRNSATGGELDVDMNAGDDNLTSQPVENIYWPPGKAPHGKYRVFVNYFANRGGKDPTTYKVSILIGGQRKEFTGTISSGQPKRLITEFAVNASSFVDPKASDLRLAVSPELIVNPGGKNELKIRIARTNFKGPVTCRITGDLKGLASPEVKIAANATEATAEITADPSAQLGVRNLTVVASSKSAKAEATFRLAVNPMPPELRLAVSPAVTVNQGASSQMRVHILRSGFSGPVHLRLAGDLRGITPNPISVAETETDITTEIHADANAPEGERTLTVIAQGRDVDAETSFQLTVSQIPPELRLALPSEIRINPAGQTQLPVRIARDRFQGPVQVRLEGDIDGLSPREFTIPADRDDDQVTLSAARIPVGIREIRVSAINGKIRSEGQLQVMVEPSGRPQWSWSLVFVIGLWTALLTLGLSLALVAGQNWCLSRPWLSISEFAIATVGSIAAGVVAGGVGQTLYSILMQIRLIPEIGFLAGWVLLGCLLGRGLGFFIPNLSAWRAVVAGSCGGFFGASAFIGVSFIGDMAGRFVGAAILGLSLGLMVAIVETAFRKIWLEVIDGDGAVRVVNLGATPVFIGGDPRRCTVVVPGAPLKALKFWEEKGQIYCLDILPEKTSPVTAGYRHQLKNSEVVVCSNDKQAKSTVNSVPTGRPKAPSPLPQRMIEAANPKVGPQPAAFPVAKPAPPSRPTPNAPPLEPATVSASGPCPTCGAHVKGAVGKRRCRSCWTTF